jgi:hypothetical protein
MRALEDLFVGLVLFAASPSLITAPNPMLADPASTPEVAAATQPRSPYASSVNMTRRVAIWSQEL